MTWKRFIIIKNYTRTGNYAFLLSFISSGLEKVCWIEKKYKSLFLVLRLYNPAGAKMTNTTR